jgi:signal transduction histidine kinase
LDEEFRRDVDAIHHIDLVPLLLDVVARRTGMKFVAIARVTEERWVTCSSFDRLDFGLKPGDELNIATTICNDVRGLETLVIFDDAQKEAVFCDHVAVKTYGFRSYFSVPISLSDGTFFGTLCGIDPEPRSINNEEVIGMLTLFSDLIARHLELAEQVKVKEEAIRLLNDQSDAREQILAVLAHDIRNPLAAIDAGVRILKRMPLPAQAEPTLRLMNASMRRAAEIVDNAMDFARSRLGDPIASQTLQGVRLPAFLLEVVEEMTAAMGDRFQLEPPPDVDFDCDPGKLAQLLANLLRNAVTHGDADGRIVIKAEVTDESVAIGVANQGPAIPEAVRASLFQPYTRGGDPKRGGLGLGLFIASEIARAHAGSIDVVSDADGTRFTLRMPRRQLV